MVDTFHANLAKYLIVYKFSIRMDILKYISQNIKDLVILQLPASATSNINSQTMRRVVHDLVFLLLIDPNGARA